MANRPLDVPLKDSALLNGRPRRPTVPLYASTGTPPVLCTGAVRFFQPFTSTFV